MPAEASTLMSPDRCKLLDNAKLVVDIVTGLLRVDSLGKMLGYYGFHIHGLRFLESKEDIKV